jgi:hypothetical protein
VFAKRRADGTFKEMEDVGRSLGADRRRSPKRTVKSGHGDQGDRPRATKGSKKLATSLGGRSMETLLWIVLAVVVVFVLVKVGRGIFPRM